MAEKTEKQLVKRKKFIDVDVPIIRSKIELIGDSPKVLKDRTINLDMTRQLKGKSVELVLKIDIINAILFDLLWRIKCYCPDFMVVSR